MDEQTITITTELDTDDAIALTELATDEQSEEQIIRALIRYASQNSAELTKLGVLKCG